MKLKFYIENNDLSDVNQSDRIIILIVIAIATFLSIIALIKLVTKRSDFQKIKKKPVIFEPMEFKRLRKVSSVGKRFDEDSIDPQT